jgi:MinD-like ATPase involved in chromosome partitioning or flagellar assembly
VVAVAFVSAKGSPGCTTTALALSSCWPEVAPDRRVLLAECDPAGGDIASGYLRGNLDGSRGLVALAGQRSPDALAAVWEQLLALDDSGRRLLLQGTTDPRQASGLGTAWSALTEAMGGLELQEPPVDVLLDLGRLHTTHEPVHVRQRADLVVLVTRSSLPVVAAARAAAAELGAPAVDGGSQRVACLVVGEGQPYSAKEISEACALPLVGVLPYDPVSAATFSTGAPAGRRLPRSPLMRSVRALATSLLDEAVVTPEVVGAGRG